jgi:hypothetical protein
MARKMKHTLSGSGRQDNTEDDLQEIKMNLTGGFFGAFYEIQFTYKELHRMVTVAAFNTLTISVS